MLELKQHDRLLVRAYVPGKDWYCPMVRPPLRKPPSHLVTGLELAAGGVAGLELQQPHRFTSQLMEQLDTGQHSLHVLMSIERFTLRVIM